MRVKKIYNISIKSKWYKVTHAKKPFQIKWMQYTMDWLRGIDPRPLLLFFTNEIQIVLYLFSSSPIEYNSDEKEFKAWSGTRIYKYSTSCLIMTLRNLDPVDTFTHFLKLHEKIKNMKYVYD